jgi:hypothetical protein
MRGVVRALDAAIVNGSDVRVLFTLAPTGTALTTTAAQIKIRPAELQGSDGDRIEIDGIIAAYVSSPSVTFTLDGRSVAASAAVVAAAGSLGTGTKIEAKGNVTNIDLADRTFTVTGVVLHASMLTIFHDLAWKGANPLSTLLTTDNVSVEYYTDANLVNQAVRVERQ